LILATVLPHSELLWRNSWVSCSSRVHSSHDTSLCNSVSLEVMNQRTKFSDVNLKSILLVLVSIFSGKGDILF
jgi:hypothetical protein